MSIKLSPIQQRVFDVLNASPNTDIGIPDLWGLAYPEKGAKGEAEAIGIAIRDMQQELGPLFARINVKLKRCRIVPGELKQTYRLDTVNFRD